MERAVWFGGQALLVQELQSWKAVFPKSLASCSHWRKWKRSLEQWRKAFQTLNGAFPESLPPSRLSLTRGLDNSPLTWSNQPLLLQEWSRLSGLVEELLVEELLVSSGVGLTSVCCPVFLCLSQLLYLSSFALYINYFVSQWQSGDLRSFYDKHKTDIRKCNLSHILLILFPSSLNASAFRRLQQSTRLLRLLSVLPVVVSDINCVQSTLCWFCWLSEFMNWWFEM